MAIPVIRTAVTRTVLRGPMRPKTPSELSSSRPNQSAVSMSETPKRARSAYKTEFENSGPFTGASKASSCMSSNSVLGGSRKSLGIFLGVFMRVVMVAQRGRTCRSRTEEASLGMDDLTRYPGCLIPGQESHEPRRILGLSYPPQWELR